MLPEQTQISSLPFFQSKRAIHRGIPDKIPANWAAQLQRVADVEFVDDGMRRH